MANYLVKYPAIADLSKRAGQARTNYDQNGSGFPIQGGNANGGPAAGILNHH